MGKEEMADDFRPHPTEQCGWNMDHSLNLRLEPGSKGRPMANHIPLDV